MLTVSLKLTNKLCLCVGGGHIAERRIEKLLREGAKVMVISPTITQKINSWHEEGRLEWLAEAYSPGMLPEAFLVLATTDDESVNRQCAEESRKKGALVNRADNRKDCDFTWPAEVDLGDILLTLSTNNSSPRLNRLLGRHMAEHYAPLVPLVPVVKRMRDQVQLLLPSPKEREIFWQTNLTEADLDLVLEGKLSIVEEKLNSAISSLGSKL